MSATFTQIFVNGDYDASTDTNRDELFSNVYEQEISTVYAVGVGPFVIIQRDDDGVLNDITADYDAYAERRNEEREAA